MTTEKPNKMARAYFGPYSLRGLKLHDTDDGYAYVCDLLKDGERVAQVQHDGTGGAPRFRWDDPAAESAFESFARSKPSFESHGMTMDVDGEGLIDELVCREDFLKKNARKMRTHVFLQIGDQIGGEDFSLIKIVPSPKAFEAIRRKYAPQPVFILNEDASGATGASA